MRTRKHKTALVIGKSSILALTLAFYAMASGQAWAKVDKVRAMYRDDPATSIVIGWNQASGHQPALKWDTVDHGLDGSAYPNERRPDRVVEFRNMSNHFVRLKGLQPNTRYYFVIQDSEGVSDRFWVLTGPGGPETFTFMSGGDMKSTGTEYLVGQEANKMVARLRPLFVLFTGDFTSGDGTDPGYWDDWLDNWSSQTTTPDGRLIPILVLHGNHENGDYTTLNKLFDTPDVHGPFSYYGVTFGKDFLHIIVLNTELLYSEAPAGEFEAQQAWLNRELKRHQTDTFKLVAYHKPLRSQSSYKWDQPYLQKKWAPLFDRYGVTMAIEGHGHLHKVTFPVRFCQSGPGCFENFKRNDENGVVYIGEGSWGARPRPSDDQKPWTLDSQSINQIKWQKVIPDDPETAANDPRIEIRTINTRPTHVNSVKGLTESDKNTKVPDGIHLVSNPLFGNTVKVPFETPPRGVSRLERHSKQEESPD